MEQVQVPLNLKLYYQYVMQEQFTTFYFSTLKTVQLVLLVIIHYLVQHHVLHVFQEHTNPTLNQSHVLIVPLELILLFMLHQHVHHVHLVQYLQLWLQLVVQTVQLVAMEVIHLITLVQNVLLDITLVLLEQLQFQTVQLA